MTTFATPARARAGVADPQRTCVVTRQVRPEHELIRFVLDPCARVVVDLKHRLPGRGVWVTAQRAALEEAVRRKAFARGFRRQVEVDQDLPEQVAAALRSSALGSLGLARKAGAALSGFAKVDALVRAGEAACVLHALEAAGDGVAKIRGAVRASAEAAPPVWQIFAGSELDLALGGGNVIHAAVKRAGQGLHACAAIARYADFQGEAEAGPDTELEHDAGHGAPAMKEAAGAAARDN